MNAQQVLGYLQHSSLGVHTAESDEEGPSGWRKTRVVAIGDVVVLDPDDKDDTRAREVIRNAERLTGITFDEGDAER